MTPATSSTAAPVSTVLDTAVDAIISIDTDCLVRLFNRSAERMFGYAAEEIIGRNVNLLMPEVFANAHDGYVRAYLATGIRKIIGIGREVVARRKDGSTFPADLAVGEDPDDPVHRFVGFIRDITDRKRQAEQIREQAELIDLVQEAIFVRGLDDRISYWNRGAERLYGWAAADAIGRPASEVLIPVDPVQVAEARRCATIHGRWSGEIQQKRLDGRVRTVESHWTLLRGETGEPKAFIVIHHDITEKKNLERRSLRSQRLESIGTLAGGIAHDLNNVLTPILMAVKLLRKDRPPEERTELLDTAQASVERGTALIRQLLTFAGGGPAQKAPVNLADVVAEVRSLLDHTLMKSIALQSEVPNDLWRVAGDATQLSQVVMNLCVNARDAMPGGGTLTLTAENLTLCHPVVSSPDDVAPGSYVRITVTDTGTGIPPDVMDKIFDPFFTTKEFGKGTGLGLSTVLGIARGHGGAVNVYSEPGRGTRVAVYLPALGQEPRERVAPTGADRPQGRGEQILVVDDEAPILTTVRLVLESAGYRVLTASGGAAALEAFRRHRGQISAIIMDMMMPEMDGRATLAELGKLDTTARVITASGLRPADFAAAVGPLRPRAFLQKPYSEDELLRTLADVLRG